MKKLLSFFLTICLLVCILLTGLFNLTSSAATSGTTGDCTWSLDGTALTINGNGSMKSYGSYSSLPWGKGITSVVIEYGVTNIGNYAFQECTNLISVTIGNSITSIGDSAFSGCTSLTSITIPNRVTSIGPYAFDSCSGLTSITIPNSVTSIGSHAFDSCNGLTSITIPDSVTSIGSNAFYNCSSLTSITIPNRVTSIGYCVFTNCESLASITVDNDNSIYSSVDGVLFNKTKTEIICYPAGKSSTSYNIPNDVTNIGDNAFSGCTSFTSITIPNSVTHIGKGAFEYCTSLESITLPFVGSSRTASRTSDALFGYIFGYATSTTISYKVKAYYNNTNSAWYYYLIPPSIKTVIITDAAQIPYGAFYNCKNITSITLSDSVTTIDDTAFYNCTSLENISIPSRVTSLSGSAFSSCTALENVNVSSLEAWCNIDFETPDSNPLYGRHLYLNGQEVKELVIPNSVTSIGDYAFNNCTSLTNITIPNSVTSIGESAFAWCNSLVSVTVDNENNNYSSVDGVLFNKTKTEIICYPAGKTSTSYAIPNSVTSISNCAFSSCHNLSNVTIPDSVTSIGVAAFEYCAKLASITIPNSVSIGDYAFYDCKKLTNVYYRGSVNDKSNLLIGSDNSILTNAIWYYEFCIDNGAHTYVNSCDTICDVCGCTRSITHDYKWVVDKNATCGEIGIKHEECTVCNKKHNENTEIPATGNHTYDNACDKECNVCKQIRTVPDHVYDNACDTTCNICGATRTITHDYKWVTDRAATCYQFGLKHRECSVCFVHEDGSDNTMIAPTGNHNYDWVIDVEPSCYETGLKHEYCTETGCASTRSEGTVIPATENHTYEWKVDKEQNCGETGLKHEYCTNEGCPSIRNENTIIEATGNHDWDWNVDLEATCASPGSMHLKCKVCESDSTVVMTVPATGNHSYQTIITKATTKTDGSIVSKCSVCNDIESSKFVKYTKTFTLSTTSYTYNGAVKTPTVTVKDSAGKVLKKDTDYKVTYPSGRKSVGTYKVTVTMMGNYSGTKTLSFKINAQSVSNCKISLSATSYTYNGAAKTPAVTVKNASGTKLTNGTHYTVTYSSGRKNVGTYKVTIKMKGNYSGTKTLTFKINPKIKLSATSYTYNGKTKTPTVTVTNSSGKKISTKYYTISYSSGRKNVGTYTATIKFKNGHSGTYKYTFKINPVKTTVSKLTAGKKSITVAITKKSTQVTGYQIQYSTSKSFSKATTKTISSYKTTKYTLKSLSAKKTYYVRVRTYKTVGKTKYYSGWSTYKYVKTK